MAGLPDYYSSLQKEEHIVHNHTESKADHCQHPMQQEKKHLVSLYQSMCNVT